MFILLCIYIYIYRERERQLFTHSIDNITLLTMIWIRY